MEQTKNMERIVRRKSKKSIKKYKLKKYGCKIRGKMVQYTNEIKYCEVTNTIGLVVRFEALGSFPCRKHIGDNDLCC